jgi:hypothetical protein
MRTVACFILLSAIFCDVARCDDSRVVHTNMAGNVACVGYLKARSERKTTPFELWLSGYLTGLATYDRKINNVPKLEIANGETGTLLLESYCKMHPQESYQVAAREMARTVFYGAGRKE